MQNSILNFLMPLITNFGNLFGWIFLSALFYFFGGRFGRKVAILCIASLLLSNVLVILLKYIIAEPRPFLALPNVDLLTPENGSSFPSGHTASAFAGATVIGLKYYKRGKEKNWLIYPLLVFAIVIGYSRIYVGVHYPYDVIFGGILGVACALFILRYEKEIFEGRLARLIGLNRIISINPLGGIMRKLNL